ncbi:HAD family hydrolase [Streptomyces sp. S07_1.15]|uniref:HAD family hydrolase n=1 Tax=Streptomyces sp. S07_1.15 TaxID=2873925 RepID=UPI001D13624B|nr:HAD-IA family hydrolase [Streptomyces sp. S07_1.15]MCC3653135.1 HAD family hydrolase [Streptomyces sp. S07_1.15]
MAEARSGTGRPDPAALGALLASVKCVLFDFDGPVCDLFARHPAPAVADTMRARLRRLRPAARPAPVTATAAGAPGSPGSPGSSGTAHGTRGSGLAGLPGVPDVPATRDPHALLHALALGAGAPGGPGGPPGPAARSGIVAELERLLAAEEIRAAASAEPTPYADELVQRLHATGHALAVTTNNTAGAAEAYLERRGLAELFRPHIHGRVTEPWLLKPDPDCLHRALRSTGHDAAMAVMIGDSTADLLAARAAGVRFLGYARDETRWRRLRDAGAGSVVTSLGDVLAALPERRQPAG